VRNGASGYLLKGSTADEIADAVRRAAAGEPVFTAELAGLVLSEFRRVSPGGDRGSEPRLTPTEGEILVLVAKGFTYREIADRRVVSVKTVQNHVQNILSKLHMHSRYELMRYAIRKGLDRASEPD
jgi:DNA-binding NarL/FixJ family response regulator